MAKRKAEWQNRYIEKVYDRINLLVDKGNKRIIKARAEQLGESVNTYINRLISEDLERSSAKDAR